MRGHSSGFSIDRTERSTSRSGQYRWSVLGHSTLRIFVTAASANHGNFSNETNISRPAQYSQKPCAEMLVTSTSEVTFPGLDDFSLMVSNDCTQLADLPLGNGWGRVRTGSCPKRNPRLRSS